MAYSDFTLAKVKEMFGLTLEETQNLFVEVEGVQPSELLRGCLKSLLDSKKAHSV